MTTEARTLARAATRPASASPSSGPDDHEIISTPARRPRRWSGIVSFQIAERKMPLIVSIAPATTRHATASHSALAKPKATIATPHAAAAEDDRAPVAVHARASSRSSASRRSSPPTGAA